MTALADFEKLILVVIIFGSLRLHMMATPDGSTLNER
ncbi:hypothetical protein ANAEL_00432 [Anaerolineales bacterium]|nr:hypothetical protein ANAEL_00432 [Anaerolineales bacterium]